MKNHIIKLSKYLLKKAENNKAEWEDFFRKFSDQLDKDKPFDMQKVMNMVSPEELVEWDHLAEQGIVPWIMVSDSGTKTHYLGGPVFAGGVVHRKWGPAVESKNGYKEWVINNKKHREDGPAVIRPSGQQEWWRNGKLHREDGPAVIWEDGGEEWWYNNKVHRDGGLPAISYPGGFRSWEVHGKKHRIDGPAEEFQNGDKHWWLNGIRYPDEQHWQDAVRGYLNEK